MERLLECKKCNTIVGRVVGDGKVCCCGETLTPIIFDETVKLNPEITVKNEKVSINLNCKQKKFKGFIYLKTLDGGQRKVVLNRNDFCFLLCEDKPITLTIYIENVGVYISNLTEIYR